MAKYNGTLEEILDSIHNFTDSDDQNLINVFSQMGFPLDEEYQIIRYASERTGNDFVNLSHAKFENSRLIDKLELGSNADKDSSEAA
ncbi:hypothetical protein [Levilactobacillus andaensis]|uniref:hypothetical protein n=1 Tax=Levilactobacillus andaensis TaxID=2799570 RepID=UPI001940B6B0|nr:hypothetical protein [Levilactobacillus andaensis]